MGATEALDGSGVSWGCARDLFVASATPCSCETQRGEDADLPRNASTVFFTDENSACVQGQTQVSNAAPYIAGTFVWTMHE